MSSKTYCFFSAQYLPSLGGVERYTYHLAREVAAAGNRVVIVTSGRQGQPDFEEDGPVSVFRLPSYEWMGGRFPVLKWGKETKKITDRLDRISIDYVVINTRLYLLSYYAARYAWKRKLPSILIEHGTGHIAMGSAMANLCGHIYEHALVAMIKRKIKHFYGVSEECTRWLEHFHIRADGVLYNSIDYEQIQKLYEVEDDTVRNAVDYHDGDVIITYTGRLIPEKGIKKLIAAVEQLSRKDRCVKLCIAGGGELYEEIAGLSGRNVRCLGRLEFEQVIQLLKITDIYCLPTDYPEGLPTSVLEAIACRTYVITTRAGGSKEVITDSSFGTILEHNSVEEIAGALCDVMEHPDRRRQAVELAHKRVCKMFTWKVTARKLMELFEGAAE